MASVLHVNIRTILSHCDELSQNDKNHWQLKKFIKCLDKMIDELRESTDLQAIDHLPAYLQRLAVLKKLTNYIDEPPALKTDRTKMHNQACLENAMAEICQIKTSKQYRDLRKELMNNDGPRQRKLDNGAGSMIEAVKYYNDAQEKITEHMLSLTRNLKEQTKIANRIIKRDTRVVSHSAMMTDKNINSLHKETEKLDDQSRNARKCWMVLLIAFVLIVFVGMVLFMKLVKKRRP